MNAIRLGWLFMLFDARAAVGNLEEIVGAFHSTVDWVVDLS
jgi:hypothetical protein